MAKVQSDPLDVAIIGGGVSGLYTAWRLSEASGKHPDQIAVFESSDRIGGRLWSVGLRSEKAIPAELGGMFFSDSQSLVYDLCTRRLDIRTTDVLPKPDFAYLRAKRFRISDFDKPGVPPYQFAKDEEEKPYHQLLFGALYKLLPHIRDQWPFNPKKTYSELVQYLRNASVDGRCLHHWGFWNLLAKTLSNEAYLCLRDIGGSFALFSNWNAYDACLSFLSDANGTWHRLPGGYQELPEVLADNLVSNGVGLNRDSRALNVHRKSSELLTITIENNGVLSEYNARHVVLALPKYAINGLVSNSELLQSTSIPKNLESVESIAACKIFLTFDEPWWRNVPDGPGKIDKDVLAISHTDLPMSQCYYLGMDSHTGEGLVLASYSDAQSVPFWSALMTASGKRSGLVSDVPDQARAEIRRQLSEMHAVDVPMPNQGMFVDWTAPPYGGGWHAWQPGWRSQEVMAELRSPKENHNIHICGETVSAYQGWVEGALTSAEVLLQEEFDLTPPEWLTSTECLAPYVV